MEMTREIRDNLITSLYDRYGKGEISINQRELLIQKINDKFYTESVAIMNENTNTENEPEVEPAIEPEETSNETPTNEKFDLFKESVDKKFEAGEITEELREQLLEKARAKFC